MILLQTPVPSHCHRSQAFLVFPKVSLVSHAVLLLLVLSGQLLVEIKCSLLLPALEERACDFSAQAVCIGFQEYGGIEDAEEQPHDKQHRGVGRLWGTDPAVGRAEGQIMLVTSFKVPKW